MPVRVVPMAPPTMDLEGIRAALPIKGAHQWQPMAKNAIYLAGKGGSLSALNPRVGIAPGSSAAYHNHIWPRGENRDRLWIVTIGPTQAGSGTDSANAFGTITDSTSGDSEEWVIHSGKPKTFYLVTRYASSSTPTSMALTVTNNASSETNVSIHSVSFEELPRVELESTQGPDGSTCLNPHPIYELADGSVKDVATKANSLKEVARRNGLFDWCEEVTGVAITTGAFTGTSNIFVVDPPVLGRKVRNSSDVRECEWNVYAKVNSGAGEVRVTATSGDSSTITVNSTSPNWYTIGTFDVDAEHMSRLPTDGGIRDGVRDQLTFEGRVTTATTLTVYAISVGEDAQ